MVWNGKHTPVLIVTTPALAEYYSKRTRPIGTSVTASLTPRKAEFFRNENGVEERNPGTKTGSGAEKYAEYRTPLGEKRSVKN